MISPVSNGSVKLTSCSRALSKSGLLDVDYALNPYFGCAHGCLYCYAPDVLRCERGLEWGDWVEARVNISRMLKKDIREVGNSVIGLSTVTDPYQPVEKQLGLTRACLTVISESSASLMLMTKSPLVLRDKDIIGRLRNAEVCITITTLDDRISSLFESKVAAPKERLAALRELSDAGIRTDAMASPLLVSGNDPRLEVEQLIEAVAETGCRSVTFDRLRLRETGRHRLKKRYSGTPDEEMVGAVLRSSERIDLARLIEEIIESKKYPKMRFQVFEQ